MSIFLRAHWRNLAIVSYAVPEEILIPYLPAGCELDRIDGAAFASLVAFEFLDTRVLGIKVPGFVNFLEWNLRLYVRQGSRRGVVFVREFVPSRMIAAIARWGYNESYENAALRQEITRDQMRYGVSWKGDSGLIALGLKPQPQSADHSSREHFFKEHQWGFGSSRSGERIAYEVVHPVWYVLPVTSVSVEIDWAALYGRPWAAMQGAEPYHAAFAVGSDVTVSWPMR
ncbi:MAG: DUF2071 domain-containing protein [Acidobacteriaceae bacterium]